MNHQQRSIVVALGGNAILQPGQVGTFEEQLVNVDSTAHRIAKLIAQGDRVVLTHGNGPQVGNLLIQNEVAAKQVAPMPMDVCGAESQGQIGYMLQQSIRNYLRRMGIDVPVATLLTETEVDADDPAFAAPSKPVGPFYTEARAKELALEQGYVMREDAGRGWRRVVPSPVPTRIVQREIIRRLVADGTLVICSGGGGIPVIRNKRGAAAGVAAVIDKDLAAALLARDVDADILVILTDVPHAYLNYGTDEQIALQSVDFEEMAVYQKQGHFRSGSMGPKIDAAIRFVASGGEAVIANLLQLEQAVAGEAGTHIVTARRPSKPAQATAV